MEITQEIREKLGDAWLADIYRHKIRSLRTRSHDLPIPARENSAVVQHTLLGVELKVGKVRLACPDLSTARYLRVFARLGCQQIAVPYDISKISNLADELESSWQQVILNFGETMGGKTPAVIGKMRSALIKEIRNELSEIGAGERMPEFKQSTKQRI